MKYTVLIERSGDAFGAYVPDLPGCIAVGRTEGEVRLSIREAIAFHLHGLSEEGFEIPQTMHSAIEVEVENP